MSFSRSPTTITCGAQASRSCARCALRPQRADSFAATTRARRGPAARLPRVQI